MNAGLSEETVSDAFHNYLKLSLAQAKAERLLDTEVLSSAEADLMITGPALCLYFAALRSTTTPPSVPLPRRRKDGTGGGAPVDLSPENCPPAFVSFMGIWSRNVDPIQSLPPEEQHDLARIICGLPPMSAMIPTSLNRIAAELRAVAIEISQRRTFQDRYAADLQSAIDAGEGGRLATGPVKATFVPPPMYDDAMASPPPPPHPASPNLELRGTGQGNSPPRSPSRSGDSIRNFLRVPRARTISENSNASSSSTRTSPSRSPPMLNSPAISLIRETLYASLGDVLVEHPRLRSLLKRDPPRAYFSAVSLAILDVARNRTRVDDGEKGGNSGNSSSRNSGRSSSRSSNNNHSRSDSSEETVTVVGVLGATLTLNDCPNELRPFMRELGAIGQQTRFMEEEDSEVAMRLMQAGKVLPTPRVERVRRMLVGGIGAEYSRSGSGDARESNHHHEHSLQDGRPRDEGRRSVEGRAVAFANRINALALAMTKLRAFRERQEEVFKVLAGITS